MRPLEQWLHDYASVKVRLPLFCGSQTCKGRLTVDPLFLAAVFLGRRWSTRSACFWSATTARLLARQTHAKVGWIPGDPEMLSAAAPSQEPHAMWQSLPPLPLQHQKDTVSDHRPPRAVIPTSWKA